MMQGISNYISEVVRGKKIRVGGKTAQWKKVKELKINQKIAVLSKDSKSIEWEEIVEIKKIGREQVWDIEVEGTHNFVAGHCVDAKTGKSLTKEEEKQYLEDLKQATKKSSDVEDLVSRTSSLNGWTDNLEQNIPSLLNFVKRQNTVVDPPGIAPGRLGLSVQPSKLAGPTTNSLSQNKTGYSRWKNKDIVFGGILAHNTYAAIFGTGTVGVGTTAPAYKLDVQDSQAATVSAQIFNTNTTDNADGLQIRLGINDNAAAGNRFLTFVTGSGTRQQMVGSITGNGTGGVTLNSPGTDFAEWFDAVGATSDYKEGDLMCLGENGFAEKCGQTRRSPSTSSGQSVPTTNTATGSGSLVGGDLPVAPQSVSTNILGIISSRYTVLGGTPGPNKVIIGLVGQLPVKIDANSPAIPAGDILTASSLSGTDAINRVSTAGTATKLTGAGYAVGRALYPIGESSTSNGASTWMVKLEVGYHQTADYIARLNDLVAGVSTSSGSLVGGDLPARNASHSDAGGLVAPHADRPGGLSLQNISSPDATISGSLVVLGDTTLSDVTVTGRASFGLLDLDGMKSQINSLGGDLNFQTNALDKINFEGGKIVMNTNGNIVTIGEVTAAKFNVKSTDDSSQSAGSITIAAGQTTVTIQTTALTDKSLIFVSAVANPVAVSTEKVGIDKFEIKINNKLTSDIKINWWVIN